ncbi:hypothetical protein CRG98_011952, partial [Punica granatum]
VKNFTSPFLWIEMRELLLLVTNKSGMGFNGRGLSSLIIPRLIFMPSTPRPPLCNHVMRYSHRDHNDERAPSTAQEFKRVAEERLSETERGIASQTVDKTYDGTEEAVMGNSDSESVKKKYKEHEENADYPKTGDDEPGERRANTVRGS